MERRAYALPYRVCSTPKTRTCWRSGRPPRWPRTALRSRSALYGVIGDGALDADRGLIYLRARAPRVGEASRVGRCAAWYYCAGAGESTLFDRIPEPDAEGDEIGEVMAALNAGGLEYRQDIESVVGGADDIQLGFHSGATLEQARAAFEADGFEVVADSRSARPGARWPWELIRDPTAPFDVRFQPAAERAPARLRPPLRRSNTTLVPHPRGIAS